MKDLISKNIKEPIEFRKWPRHEIQIPVSIKCKGAFNHEASWHVGVTRDISVEGIMIEAGSLPEIKVASKVTVLCFPKKDTFASYIPDPEPVRMTGLVIWQDKDKNLIGVKILADA